MIEIVTATIISLLVFMYAARMVVVVTGKLVGVISGTLTLMLMVHFLGYLV